MTSTRPEPSVSRTKILQDGIERLTRLLQAERASSNQEAAKTFPVSDATVATGFDALFAKAEGIPPTVVEPYSNFSTDLWMGFETLDGTCWAVIEFDAATLPDPESRMQARAPRLTVHPVIAGPKWPRWFSVECKVDQKALLENPQFVFNILSNFRFPERMHSGHVNTVSATLRCDFGPGEYRDMPLCVIPVTTAPMMHRQHIRLGGDFYDSARNCSSLRLILWVPVQGGYEFNIYGLSLGAP